MRVFIGVDPHKLSATIEVVDDRENVLAKGRFGTDKAGYSAMRKVVAGWSERTWAVEGSNGPGRPLAQRLLADGETGGRRAGEAECSGPVVRHRA
jgi:transposase